MASADIQTSWTHGSSNTKITAKRQQQTSDECAEEHVGIVLEGGDSTSPASGEGDGFIHVVVWSKGGIEFTSTCRSFVSQTEADDLADALKAEVVAAGGAVISG